MKMTWARTLLGLLAIGCFLAFSGNAEAARGFYLGTGMGAVFPSMSGDVDDVDPGSGYNFELIHLGYNFTDRLGLSLQWGAGAGPADDFLGDDTVWSQGYFTYSFRYSHDTGNTFVPYFEAGAGTYDLLIIGDHGEFFADPVVGARFALGGHLYWGGFYLAPEIAYHMAQYTEGEFELDYPIFRGYPRDFSADFDSRGDMLVAQVKVGYHFIWE